MKALLAAGTMHTYYDFFAGGGMAGVGLGPSWSCLFANDTDPKKALCYRANRNGGGELLLGDVAAVTIGDLRGRPDLVWASFPCQDLSLAGKRAGLAGERSGTFGPFWNLVRQLHGEGRGPKLIVLENVCGVITSNHGRDFVAIASAFADLGYRFGALVVDAARFLPQSRPRFFMIGVRRDVSVPADVRAGEASPLWHPSALVAAQGRLPGRVADRWLWWRLPEPPRRNVDLSTLIQDDPCGAKWHSDAKVEYLLSLMAESGRAKVEAAKRVGRRIVGTVFRRTRRDADGVKRQRAEVRFDGVAGCLRTPAGGSSRQIVMLVEGQRIRSRLLSPREAAKLMGLPETYALPSRCNDAYKLVGDGVAVPVVRHLAEHVLEPILSQATKRGPET